VPPQSTHTLVFNFPDLLKKPHLCSLWNLALQLVEQKYLPHLLKLLGVRSTVFEHTAQGNSFRLITALLEHLKLQ